MAAKSGKKKSGFIRFIKWLFVFLNVLAVLALILSYLSPFVSPASSAYIPFFGLAYPILVLMNLGFVLIWLFANWRWAFLSLLTIAAGWFLIRSHVQYSGQHRFSETEIPIKLTSYNVRNFDIYNYSKDWVTNTEKRNKIFAYLKEDQPDILCFQEFVHDRSNVFRTLDTLTEFLNAKNVHAEYTFLSRNTIEFGIATFTKYPIVGQGRIDFNNSTNNLCIFTDVLIGEDTVRIYNAHFESIHFSYADYQYAEDLATSKDVDQHKGASRRIFSLLKAAFIDRASQAELVAKHIKSCPYPILLCTDLNDTPASYAYQQLTDDLDDAFIECGSGLGSTYEGIFPSFRIDYLFHSDDFEAYNFVTRKLKYSDHYPVSCDMVLKKGE